MMNTKTSRSSLPQILQLATSYLAQMAYGNSDGVLKAKENEAEAGLSIIG